MSYIHTFLKRVPRTKPSCHLSHGNLKAPQPPIGQTGWQSQPQSPPTWWRFLSKVTRPVDCAYWRHNKASVGEKWDQSAPKGHNNKFPIWQHYPWTRAWDDDNQLFNSNKQSSVFLQQQAVFQQAAFCSDLIQVVSTAAGLCLSKKNKKKTTTCKQDDSKAGFLVNPRILSKQTMTKKQSGTVALELASFSLLGILNTQNEMYSEKCGGMGWQKALVAG